MEKIVSNLIVIKNGEKQQLSVLKENCNQNIQELLEMGSIIVADEYAPISNNGKYEYYDYMKHLNVYIPKKIDTASITLAYEVIESLENNSNFIDRFIYNYREDDYDYYHEGQAKLNRISDKAVETLKNKTDNSKIEELISYIEKGIDIEKNKKELLDAINDERKISNIFLIFAKEKLNLLSNKENKMVQAYRNFDLERLLTADNIFEYSLNNGGAGCISIFEDDIISSTATKMQHGEETKYHLRKRGLGDISDVSQAHVQFNLIEIQLYKDTLVIYTPNNLNEYQKEQLLSILNQVKQIEINHQEKIDVHIDKYQQEENYSTDINDVIMFVNGMETKVNSK